MFGATRIERKIAPHYCSELMSYISMFDSISYSDHVLAARIYCGLVAYKASFCSVVVVKKYEPFENE
jgi:hypothetical protein